MHIFTDGLSKISFANGNLRIVLSQTGPDNSQIEAGTLIIPGNQAANFVNSLANGLKQLDKQIMEAQKSEAESSSQ